MNDGLVGIAIFALAIMAFLFFPVLVLILLSIASAIYAWGIFFGYGESGDIRNDGWEDDGGE